MLKVLKHMKNILKPIKNKLKHTKSYQNLYKKTCENLFKKKHSKPH